MSYRFEMSEVQKGIYFDCCTGASADYNIILSLETKKLEISTLEYAANLVAAGQESLHLAVSDDDNAISFEACDDISLSVTNIESAGLGETEEIAKKYYREPFDLHVAPLLKMKYVEEKGGKFYLLICIHHLIADGISADLFVKKLFEVYEKMVAGTPFEMEISSNSAFSEFVKKENEKLTIGEYDLEKKYWVNALEGISAPQFIKEYADKGQTSDKAEIRVTIDKPLSEKILSCAQQLEVSEFMLQSAVFMATIKKTTQSNNFAITTPFTYRPEEKDEDIMGCYIYNYPLICNVGDSDSFSKLADSVKSNIYNGYMNAGYPSNLIARELNAKDGSAAGIFDYTFIYDSYETLSSENVIGMKDWSFSNYPGELTVIYQRLGKEALLRIQYKKTDYSSEYMSFFGKRMIRIMEQVVEKPDIPFSDISIFLNDEIEMIKKLESESSYFPYIEENVIDIFEQKVRNNGNQVAVITDTQKYTYNQINAKANVVAKKLQELDSRKVEKTVALYMERSIEMLVAVLGVLKAGWTYVPMDLSYTAERMQYIKKDAQLLAICSSKKFQSILENALELPILLVDELIKYEETDNVVGDRNTHYAAYVEYTSGSTGEPKGVVVEKRNVTNTVKDLNRRFPLEKKDVYMFKTSITFDISGTEIYGWIVGEGQLFILNNDEEKDTFAIIDAIQKHNVTHINFVPSMLRIFVDCLETKENREKISSLKWIFTGGEAIDSGLVEKYLSLGIIANLENVYGPTEATMWATHYSLREGIQSLNVPIGKALNEYKIYIVDKNLEKQPVYVPGELCISGAGVARGYLNKDELSKKVFIDNPFWKEGDAEHFRILYRTGDLARLLPDGNFEFLGRIDSQVKLNGMRVELGEIENVLACVEGVTSCACALCDRDNGDKVLAFFFTADKEISEATFRKCAQDRLNAAFIPSRFIHIEKMPRTLSEKIDRKALKEIEKKTKEDRVVELPSNELERIITDIWKEVLSRDQIDITENFFDAGGHSIALVRVHNLLCSKLNTKFPIAVLLNNPTIKGIAKALGHEDNSEHYDFIQEDEKKSRVWKDDVAIIGMAINVPEASNIYDFWNNLVEEKDCIHEYTNEELRNIGVEEELIEDPLYVRRKGRINDIDYFDPEFFKVTPAEVRMMSPQLRVLYKGVYHALEDAGHSNTKYKNSTGIFIGASDDFLWYQDRMFNNERYSDTYQIYTQSTNHFLATRISYMFDLMGPAMSVLTGCSTSLATVHLAYKALQNGECDVAIAGGVTVELPNEGGYLYEPNLMFSRDGKCKPFDDRADGTMFSNGMGIVVLKRLSDAKKDNDHIYAVIKGSAIRNDGRTKLSYTAPSAQGQALTMREAYRDANIDPQTVTYVEAHGTGTKLGDPIEVDSLTKVFGNSSESYCTLGSVKGNIGHTDTAAGIVGLIKAALCLENKFLPATINYEIPNKNIDFDNSPFEVRNYGMQWERKEASIPRRAGVNAFGVGGTNVHMILEENEKDAMDGNKKDKKHNIFLVSAKTPTSLVGNIDNMTAYVKSKSIKGRKNDTAWTLLNERRALDYRGYIVTDEDEIAESFVSTETASGDRKICFMFTGQGSQYQGMTRDLLEDDNPVAGVYKKYVNSLLLALPEEDRDDYKNVIYGHDNPDVINQTKYSQIALFITEYAMAATLKELGIEPDILVGHSIGEVTAAAFAGVWNIEDAINVVRMRAIFMQNQEPGSMLSVPLSKEELEKHLQNTDNVWISLCNTTNQCVVGGYKVSIDILKEILSKNGIESTILKTSHAFHTPMMNGAANDFKDYLQTLKMSDPQYQIISNITGDFTQPDMMNKPAYWADQIINTVEFEKVLDKALCDEGTVFYELGGRTLCSLAKKHVSFKNSQVFIPCIKHSKEKRNDTALLLGVFGKSHCAGLEIDWEKIYGRDCQKVYVPPYVFEKREFPINVHKHKFSEKEYAEETKEVESKTAKPIGEDDVLELVKEAFREIFEINSITDTSDFFDIGGDSMQAASLAAKIKKETRQQLSVAEIFTNSTPAMISTVIKNRMKDSKEAEETIIRKAEKAAYYPTTPAQKRMFMLYSMNKSNLAFNLPSLTVIRGNLCVEKARDTYKKLLQRHDILRTSFEMRGDNIVQVVHDDCELPFEVERINGDFDIRKIADDFVRPFSLDKAPLMRVKLVQNDEETLMLFDIHHIISDGTSVELLTRDFNELYSGELDPLEIQYKDYAIWLNENENSTEMQRQEKYWLNALYGELPYLELPTDYPRPSTKSFVGKRFNFDFGVELSDEVNKRSKELGVTNNILVMCAWNIILSRYSQIEDVIIGTSVSGRTREDIAECIGMFVNMLVIRTAPEKDKIFTEYLREVKATVAGALENQDYQFDRLVDKLNVKRRLDHNAVFDVGYDYHNITLHDFEIEGLTFEQQELDTGRVSNEVLLTCIENNEHKISGFIDYCTALFTEETISGISEALIEVLRHITETDVATLQDFRIRDLAMTSEKEKAKIQQYNSLSQRPRDYSRSITEIFEEWALSKPDETAIVTSDGKEHSYSEIRNKAINIAGNLLASGVNENDNVVIIPERDETMIAAMFAVLSIKASYVPVDISYPQERIEEIIRQSGANVAIADLSVKEKISKTVKVLDIHECALVKVASNPVSLAEECHDENRTAYILFTSGSTGKPKGVLVSRKNLLNFIYDSNERKLVGETGDRILCITSPSFDIFGYESITPLCSGSSIYICDRIEQLDAKKAGIKIRGHHVTHMLSAVSRLKAFVENKEFAGALSELKCILGGGENYPLSLLTYLKENSKAKIFNLYGPTETTIWSSAKELTDSNNITIGSAIANTQLYILDEQNHLLPRGVFGELCIAGDGVSKGYLNNEQETQAHFVRCKELSDSLIYKTGDRGRMLFDGEIELMGRMDYQVKHHGCRIELKEIENVVLDTHMVDNAVAILKTEKDYSQLFLFYKSEDDKEKEIKEIISKRLPVYMMPDRIVRLDSIPMTSNGKTDRKYLEKMQLDEIVSTHSADYVKATSSDEEKQISENEINGSTNAFFTAENILTIWKEILHNDNITENSNFFEVGGNSYSLMLVSNKVAELIGQSLDVMELFEYPTVKSFYEHIAPKRQETAKTDFVKEIIKPKETKNDVVFEEDTNINTAGKVAVIGMAGRFPGAESIDEFWSNIEHGKECIRTFDVEELVQEGINKATIDNTEYVRSKGYLDNVEYFDAGFFNINKHDANIMDPQIRVLMQCCYNAIEDANIVLDEYKGDIALFAGSSSNLMWMSNFGDEGDIVDVFSELTANDKDFLTTQISYRLNLTGPSMNVQTACSTSLVAICQAAQSLLNNDADIALAGGVSISFPRKEGYLWHENMIYSKDGHCRPFSSDSSGTVAGNGCGIVVLKSLDKAIEDKDDIYAVIEGFATNNDGIGKVGYSAPSISGQKKVIEKAIQRSGISPENIGYVETHGTGTKLGDPIELEALKQAWNVSDSNYCALGAVKANVGHLDAAAGVTGFIKAVKVINERSIPPMVNFRSPNEYLQINKTPFYIPVEERRLDDHFKNVAVSAFGIGGTNAHVILGEPPVREKNVRNDEIGLLVFSAKTSNVLIDNYKSVLSYCTSKEPELADVAYTLSTCRKYFPFRCIVVAKKNDTYEQISNSISEIVAVDSDKKWISLFAQDNVKLCELGRLLLASKAKHEIIRQFRKIISKLLESYEDSSLGVSIENILYSEEKIDFLSYEQKDIGITSDVIKNAVKILLDMYGLKQIVTEKQEGAYYFFDHDEDELTSPTMAQCTFVALIGQLWMHGFEIDMHKVTVGKKIHLPGYVFEKEIFKADVSLSHEENKLQVQKQKYESKEEVFEKFKLIWESLLGEKNVDRDRDFFDAGGDSLLSIRMAALIEKNFNVKISQDELFSSACAGDISDIIYENLNSLEEELPEDVIKPLAKQNYYEASAAQKRQYIVQMSQPESTAYNLAAAYTVYGSLNREQIENAVKLLVERHESLRTSFTVRDDDILQIVSDVVNAPIEFVDGNDDGKNIKEYVDEYVRPFDLSKAPLFRMKVVSISDDKHYLLLDMHHIISDQSSIDVLMRDFAELYLGKGLQPLEIQFKDFAAWQNRRLGQNEIKKQMDYWLGQLGEADIQTNILPDFAAPEKRTYEGKRLSFVLPELQRIDAYAKEQGITPYMLMFTVLESLIWKYTRKDKFIIGTGVEGRINESLNNLVGMFVNTLPICVSVNEGKRISELLQDTKQKILGMFRNQECQYDDIVNAFRAQTGTNEPLIKVLINYVSRGTYELNVPGLVFVPYEQNDIYAKFDLLFGIERTDEAYILNLEYASEIFSEETAVELGERYISILELVMKGNDEILGEISLPLSNKDLKAYELARNYREENADKSIAELFEEKVLLYPNNVAISFNEENITYAEFNRVCNNLALTLQKKGVVIHDRVALLLEPGFAQMAAIFATLKCGASYVPIDVGYPEERIKFMMKDSEARIVITQDNCRESIDENIDVVIINDDMVIHSNEIDDVILEREKQSIDDEIYIIYTSGSTGNPKGVSVNGRSILRIAVNPNFNEMSEGECIPQIANYAFDASIFEIFTALLNGGYNLIIPKNKVLDLDSFAEIIGRQKVNSMFFTTALFNLVVDYDISMLKNINRIFVGGETLSVNHVRKALKVLKPDQLFNAYGPTETTVYATTYPINQIPDNTISIPIGYAITNTNLYVMDEKDRLLPPGIIGELWIGGTGVANGYIGNEELTRSRFKEVTIAGKKDRIYKTGDRVILRDDGRIIFLGRQDSQVKINGFRIELSEIESHFDKIEGVRQSAILVKEDKRKAKSIIAFFTVENDEYEYITGAYIRDYLGTVIPKYMIPSKIVKLSEMPLNANKKIDRAKLIQMEGEFDRNNVNDDAKGMIRNSIVLDVMRTVLENPEMQEKDDFFISGGTSIKAIVMAQKLKNMGYEVGVNDILTHSSAEALSAFLGIYPEYEKTFIAQNTNLRRADDNEIEGIAEFAALTSDILRKKISSSDDKCKFNMSPIQKLHLKSTNRVSSMCLEFTTSKSAEKVKEVIIEEIQRHQLLHSVADSINSSWIEKNCLEDSKLLSQYVYIVDATLYDEESTKKLRELLYQKLLLDPINPLEVQWKIGCIQESENRYYLIWAFDHICFDGMSALVIKNDISIMLRDESLMLTTQKYSDYVTCIEATNDHSARKKTYKDSYLMWKKQNSIYMNELQDVVGKEKEFDFYLPKSENYEDPINEVLQKSYDFLMGLVGLDNVPVMILKDGRSIEDKKYYNCVGEFLDFSPVILNQKFIDNSKGKSIDDYGDFTLLQNITGKELGNDHDYILWNFQGLQKKEERQGYSRALKNVEKQVLSRIIMASGVDEDGIYLHVESSSGFDLEQIEKAMKKSGFAFEKKILNNDIA